MVLTINRLEQYYSSENTENKKDHLFTYFIKYISKYIMNSHLLHIFVVNQTRKTRCHKY